MNGFVVVLCVVVIGAAGLVSAGSVARRRWPVLGWYLAGFPYRAVLVRGTWRRLSVGCGWTMTRRPTHRLLGDLVVTGEPLRPIPPRLFGPRPARDGLSALVRLHPGQVPEDYVARADAIAHAWRVFAVRVETSRRGWVRLVATHTDPLASSGGSGGGGGSPTSRLVWLRVSVGARQDGSPWVIELGSVPHWLIVGATQSGKSTLVNALVAGLAPLDVALVGIDCKGGMELSLYAPRLSVLATNRKEAAGVLTALVDLLADRMALCRQARVRNIDDLPEQIRPVPIVVLVDEVAELFLSASREDKDEVARVGTALLRLAQLGAALGVHLIVAGQRVGSDLGPGVTALRAQLAGRVCHRVADHETAVMTLGDRAPDAVDAAQAITPFERGVAIVADDRGGWMRARSSWVTPDQAEHLAAAYANLTPALPSVAAGLGGGDAA